MALSEKYRTQFYAHWSEQVGEEAANAMLAQFPARDVDEPATKEFVRAEIAVARVELAEVRAELVAKIDAQTDRLMARMQIALGRGFGFVAVLTTLLAILTR